MFQKKKNVELAVSCSGGGLADFKFLLNTPDGPESSLAELKVISAGKSRYPRGVVGKGTDKRAALIPKEYDAMLWKYIYI